MAGNVVSNVKKYYGGQVPVPGQGDSDGKVKVLVEMTTTMEIGGVQTDVDLLYDADDLATPVTPQKLGQWTDENYLIVFKTKDADGKVRGFILYALETTSTSTDTLVNNATFVAFKGLETDPGASAFMFTMVEDSSTLSRYLRDENGELTVKFNLSSVEYGAQSGPLSELIGTDSSLMNFEVVRDEGSAYLNLNTEGLMDELEAIWAWIDDFIDRFDELPSDEHGYFNSSLYQTPGDGTTTSLNMDNFRISAGRDVHGDNIEFVPTHQEDGVDFGEVYLEPGTYIFTVDYTLQWVGSPRGTFLPRVANVGERPFDFSYEHEDALRTTRIVTKTARGKFGLNFPFDADTPPMGIWVKRLEIAQIASYNHPAVTHDTTLTGSGQIGDPLGVTTDVFGKVKDIPTSISQFRNGDVIPVDGPNGPAKMAKDDLLSKTAQNAFEYAKLQSYFATRQSLVEETSRATQRENEIEALFQAPTEEAVAAWLEAHPEATTTVQDHSLTYEKLVIGTLNFVTPEMFGAVGDGVTDDYAAFEAMLANGGKLCLFGQAKTYYVSGTLHYFSNTVIDFNNSTLLSGVDSHVFASVASNDNRRSNVIFRNGIIIGHGSSGHVGDQGAGILGWNIDNLFVINMKFTHTYGDGMLFRACENVTIKNCIVRSYGRNGISPISGSFYIEKLDIDDSPLTGANPGLCFDCEPEADEHTKLHILNSTFTDAFFVDFYTPNDNDDFCIELLMENTKVWSGYSGVKFISSKNLNAKNVKLINCDLKITRYESSCVFMNKVSGIIIDSCKFSHSIPSPVNTHCISVSDGVKNFVLKNVDFTGFPNALFDYTGILESITLDGVTTSIYAKGLKNSKFLNSRIIGFYVDGSLSDCTGNIAFNSILPANLRQVCKLGGNSGQFFGSTVLSNEYTYADTIFTDPGNTKIVEIPLPAEDISRGHCYLVSIGYSHRGSIGNSGQRVFAIVCGDLGATITDIVNVGSKSISISYDHAKHSLIVTFEYCFAGTMSWSVFG